MTDPLLSAIDWRAWFWSPATIGLWPMLVGLVLALPVTGRWRQRCGWTLIAVGLGLVAGGWVARGPLTPQVMFWLLAGVAVLGSAAAITMTSAIYSAVWFAFSLLGVAGLMWFQGAEFLGVSTLVVYAGAIVVTLLFVLMLAQPRGDVVYDRLSWGGMPRIVSPLVGLSLVAMLTAVLPAAVAEVPRSASTGADAANSVARLGAHLFTRHLIAVELAGTLLLVALVGAVATVMHGREVATGEEER